MYRLQGVSNITRERVTYFPLSLGAQDVCERNRLHAAVTDLQREGNAKVG